MSDFKTVHLDKDTELRLAKIAEETGRDPCDLMSTAVTEAALEYFRHQPRNDPAK